VFNLIKGMQMVQNKKVSAGLALIAGLLGMSVSGTALALPETEVGSRPGITAQAQSVESVDAAVNEEADTITADDDASLPSD
jgi:hypothetical protein